MILEAVSVMCHVDPSTRPPVGGLAQGEQFSQEAIPLEERESASYDEEGYL